MPVAIPLALRSRSIITITMDNIFNDSENAYRWNFYLVKIYNFTHTMYRYCFKRKAQSYCTFSIKHAETDTTFSMIRDNITYSGSMGRCSHFSYIRLSVADHRDNG